MALDTRAALAVVGVVALSVGVALHATGREGAGLGALAVGFGGAAGWSFVGVALARRDAVAAPGETYLATGMGALALALYFCIRTRESLSRSG